MNSLGVCIALFPLRQLNIWPLTSNEILLSAFGWRKGIFARSGTINCGPAAGRMALPRDERFVPLLDRSNSIPASAFPEA
jgi:hypothetical protein